MFDVPRRGHQPATAFPQRPPAPNNPADRNTSCHTRSLRTMTPHFTELVAKQQYSAGAGSIAPDALDRHRSRAQRQSSTFAWARPGHGSPPTSDPPAPSPPRMSNAACSTCRYLRSSTTSLRQNHYPLDADNTGRCGRNRRHARASISARIARGPIRVGRYVYPDNFSSTQMRIFHCDQRHTLVV